MYSIIDVVCYDTAQTHAITTEVHSLLQVNSEGILLIPPWWMAPELASRGGEASEKSDIWYINHSVISIVMLCTVASLNDVSSLKGQCITLSHFLLGNGTMCIVYSITVADCT